MRLSYWRRLADKVEAGVALDLAAAPGMALGPGMMTPPRREGTATVGAKYDFRASTFRAQVDSTGKVSCLLDKRIAPAVQVTFSGEIDHVKVCFSSFSTFDPVTSTWQMLTTVTKTEHLQARPCRTDRERTRRTHRAARTWHRLQRARPTLLNTLIDKKPSIRAHLSHLLPFLILVLPRLENTSERESSTHPPHRWCLSGRTILRRWMGGQAKISRFLNHRSGGGMNCSFFV